MSRHVEWWKKDVLTCGVDEGHGVMGRRLGIDVGVVTVLGYSLKIL